MSLKPLNSKEFTKEYVKFIKNLEVAQNLTLKPSSHILDIEHKIALFKFWFIDRRDMEVFKSQEKNDNNWWEGEE